MCTYIHIYEYMYADTSICVYLCMVLVGVLAERKSIAMGQ